MNKTFGIHPFLNLSLAVIEKKNSYKFVFEHRYGQSKNRYQILDNDTLKSTSTFNGQYVGLEYEYRFYSHPHHELYGNIGLGYDWIWISKNNSIRNNQTIGGIGLNAGLKYCLYIAKKHGPVFGIFYHFTDFNNRKGSKLNNNSMGILISYDFARINTGR